MLQTTKENFIYKIFIIISLLICPIVVIAPLGSWVPLAILALSCSLFNKSIYKKQFILETPKVIFVAFFWIIISTILIGKNLFILEKVFSFILLILFGLIIINIKINSSNLKKIIIVFSISFILSAILILADTKINLGLKLWLSKNFDFNNFKSFYEFKDWISFSDFRKNNFNQIISYNQTSYSRGIIGLSLLSLPLFIFCFFYNLKKLAYSIIFISASLALFTLNYTVLFSFMVALIFSVIFYFKKDIFKKYFLLFLGSYFLLCPFILGAFDYKKFSAYENYFFQKNNDLFINYCGNTKDPSNLLFRNKFSINLKCCKYISVLNKKLYRQYSEICDKKEFNNIFSSEGNIQKIKLFLKYKLNYMASKKIHRLIIWSYTKEKILEKPIIGHGFFSSRYIASKKLKTKELTEYNFIPLHPHNNVLQVWLELGIIGVIIFFIFIRFLLKKIYKYSKINHKFSAIAMMSFFQVFFIGQIGFGFWQSWWLAITLITLILYKYLFQCFKSHALQSGSLD